ncbi:MAG: formylglycine-generating enzyme family protein [Chloroflexota bacterium]
MIEFVKSRHAGDIYSIFLHDGSNFDFAWCPAGKFQRRHITNIEFDLHPEKAPWQTVQLTSGFWIATVPVTQFLWTQFMPKETRLTYDSPNFPVVIRKWTDAILFCERFTKWLIGEKLISDNHVVTLPTDAQWEYACRAGTQTKWYFGDDIEQLDKHAWHSKNSNKSVHPAKSKLPNPWGLYDVFGNVAEWCLDNFHSHTINDFLNSYMEDPLYLSEYNSKITRGGSVESPPHRCTTSIRYNIEMDNPYNEAVGIKVVILES